MRKFIFISLAFLMFGCTYAQDVDFTQALNSTSMPTDQEIRAVISQFNFDNSTQEQIFKETKKKLQTMYANKNSAAINSELNSSLKTLENGSVDEYFDESKKTEVMQKINQLPQSSSVSSSAAKSTNSSTTVTRSKKYGSNQQLFEKRSYGPQRNR